MSDFIVEKLTKSVGDKTVFKEISFIIHDLDRIGIIGVNGTGKTTLLDVVSERIGFDGDVSPFTKANGYKIAYLTQEPEFDDGKTVLDTVLSSDLREMALIREYENLKSDYSEENQARLEKVMAEMDSLDAWSIESEVKTVLSKLGLSDLSQKVGDLSGGLRRRVQLAQVLLNDADLLLLDEPTNHLDIDTIAWLTNFLKSSKKTVLFITHDRYFLDKVATVTLDLTKHSLDRYVGNYSKFMDLKAEKLATEAKNFEKQQKEIAKLEDFVNRNIVRASTTKRAQARRKQLEKIERLDKPTEGQKSANMTFHVDKVSGNVVLTVRNAAIGYDNEILSEPISLDVKKMDAIAIVGPNGVGKTTFIKSVVGKLPFIKGSSTYGANVEVGYYDQTQSALTPSNTVLDELWNDFPTTPEVKIRNRLGAFLFSGDDVKKSVSMLSGGEKARLLLAKLSMENNNFLILDEPTNHLDIDSKEVLENALIDFDGTLLFVSHDRYFINRVATKVMEISEDGATIYLGDYDYYLEKKAELEELARLEAEENQGPEETQVASAGASDYQAQKASQKEIRKLSRRIEQIENELETVEERLGKISIAMLETNDVMELSDLQKELDDLSVNQEALMEEWSDLSEQLER